jgi:hypothetical protein
MARDALFYPLTVTGKKGKTEIRFVADAAGLRDEFVREIAVAPRGFPQTCRSRVGSRTASRMSWSWRGLYGGHCRWPAQGLHQPGASTLIAGLDGMLREPGGCFEQTSSTNYPNVMILRYL